MVGARGFEPPTPASRTQYSTRLSYAPSLITSSLTASRLTTSRLSTLTSLRSVQPNHHYNQHHYNQLFALAPRGVIPLGFGELFSLPFFAAFFHCLLASDLYSPRKRRILTENLEKGKRGRRTGLREPDLPRPRRPGEHGPARPLPGWRRPRRRSRRRPS